MFTAVCVVIASWCDLSIHHNAVAAYGISITAKIQTELQKLFQKSIKQKHFVFVNNTKK